MVCQGLENISSLQHLLKVEQIEKINKVWLDGNLPDTLIFTSSLDGKFRIRTYLNCILEKQPIQPWTITIWNKFTTPRVNAFMWRLVRKALPVDEKIQSKGIMLASKCAYCVAARVETIQHLFFESDLAKKVWRHFSAILHRQVPNQPVLQFLTCWLNGVSRRSQLGYSILAISFYGLWEIWKERCAIKYDCTRKSTQGLLHAIYEHIHNVNLLHIPKRKPTNWEVIILERLGIQVKDIAVKKGKWIAWSKPEAGLLKVNTDGSKREEKTTGGGVCREDSRKFVFGFSM